MKKITLLAFLIVSVISNAQELWKKSSYTFNANEILPRNEKIEKFDIYELNTTMLKQKINNQIIALPNPGGKLNKFKFTETPTFSSELSNKFPMIKSYTAQGIDDPTAVAKLSIGTDGVHVIIFSGKHSTFYIDPYTKKGAQHIAYKRSDMQKIDNDFECRVEEQVKAKTTNSKQYKNADDGKLRTYRLAIACTGEYAQYHLNQQNVPGTASDATKKAAVLSAMNTTMTRVNGVYERDLSVRMIIVNDNDKIIYLNSTTDGLNNSDANTLINQSQQKCDSEIGAANYDVGHTFSTGAGGLAGLGVVCVNGQKGRGVTGSSQPINDPYDIDYVAHELGHQFGANHTFNGSASSCAGGNRNDATAAEPGSGSTIMAYAGICAPQNVQNNSDDHFHSISIDEMWAHIQTTGNCVDSSATNTNNATPTANAGADRTIPASTPFVLRGQATDADGLATLTYNWEQIDTEIATMPPLATNTGGPAFRSLPSKASPDRYMPDLVTVLAGNTANTWEVLPSVSREMNFSLVVRDNNAGGGSSARDDVKITVDGTAGPFVVTSQTTNTTWDVGTTQTVTWDVAGTNSGSVNTPTVNIKMSTDGGQTFPHVVATNVPNDGSHDISVPDIGGDSTTVRIMVEGNNNVFYAINSTNFSVQESEFALTLANSTVNTCKPNNAIFNFTYNTFQGFSGTTTFSAENVPTNATVTFNPTSATANGTAVTATISNIANVSEGNYAITFKGTSGTLEKTTIATLNVFSDSFSALTLTAPTNNGSGQSLTPTLTWDAYTNAQSYDVQVASDSEFTNIIASGNVTTNSYTVATLNQSTTYYWRVKAKNDCGESSYSSAFSFTTINCTPCTSEGSTTFETGTTRVIFNTIDNATPADKTAGYTDFTNISTTVKRGDSHNLTIHANTDGNYTTHTVVWIDWNQDCDFDDANETYDLGEADNVEDMPTSASPFSVTIPSDALLGSTVMRITTKYNSDPDACNSAGDAEVEDYGIVVDAAASSKDFTFNGFNLYPNPTNGSINLNFEVVNTNKVTVKLFDLRGRMVDSREFFNTPALFSQRISFNNITSGLYMLRIENGDKQTTKKIVIK